MRKDWTITLLVIFTFGFIRPIYARTVKKLDNITSKSIINFSSSFVTPLYKDETYTGDISNTGITNYTSITPEFHTKTNLILESDLSIKQTLNSHYKEILIQDIPLKVSYHLKNIIKYTNMTHSLFLIIPTSEYSKKVTSLRTSVGYRSGLSGYIKKDLHLRYLISIKRNIHKYESNVSGDVNTLYTLKNAVNFKYKFSDFFTLNFNNHYLINFDYLNERNDFYGLSQEIDMDLNNNFIVSLGHSLGSAVLTQNEQDIDIRLTKKEGSTIFMSVHYSF